MAAFDGDVRPAEDEVFERIGVEEVMRRVRSSADKRRPSMLIGVAPGDWPDGYPLWAPAALPTPTQPNAMYLLDDLLQHDDVEFVVNAYRVLLRRNPDPSGCAEHLHSLRSGERSKLEVVARLRYSSEGYGESVPVLGLRKAWLLHRLKRRRYIGRVIALLHEVAVLPRTIAALRRDLARQAHEVQHLGELRNTGVVAVAGRVEAIERLSASGLKVTRQFEQWSREREQSAAREQVLQVKMDALYSAFEDRFRGPREVVRARVAPYLDIVRQAAAGTREAPVVDVGCGRGEWLELLRDEGLDGFGIDLNSTFAATAPELGIKVVHGDAIEELRLLPPGSIGAMTSMHLVEHLPFDKVVELIESAKGALREGGVLVLETPNPENIDVATLYFYMDPTHRNPLPPEMLRWVVEACGFRDVQILRLSEERPLNAPEPVSPYSDAAPAVNHYVARTRIAPDYAIVATK